MKELCRIMTIIISVAISLCVASANQKKTERILLTSFYPMYIMAMNVADGVPGIKVVNMTKPQTGCLHDYQLTPQDMQSLSKAWILIISGGGMESFVDKAIKQYSHLKIIDASRGVDFIKNDHGQTNDNHQENHNHSDNIEQENHINHNHDDNSHEHGEVNPHVWVSISGAISQVRNIRDELMVLDSDNAAIYKKNGDAYIAKLDALKEKMQTGLSGISSRNIITFHEAFPYFAREFNLNIVAVIQREPGTEPSAKELAETIAIVKKHNVKALFAEPQYPAKAAETIARETGAILYVLDPAVSGELTHDSYLKIMERNLAVIQKALK